MSRVNLKIVAAFMCLSFAVPLYAQSYDDEDAPRPLSFGDLEYAMPNDPFLWPNDPMWAEHHTSRSRLAPAIAVLRDAVPIGTNVSDAEAIIHKAGARCKPAGNAELDCQYRDAQTSYPEWIDTVIWHVKLTVADGKVANMDVSRDWYRHT